MSRWLRSLASFTPTLALATIASAQWVIPQWQPTPGGLTNTQFSKTVSVVEIIGGRVHVGGDFDRAGGTLVNGITTWDGAAWSVLGPSSTPGFEKVAPGNSVPLALATFNNDLIVGGSLLVADDGITQLNHVARYNTFAGAFESLGFGVSVGTTNNGSVRALTTYNGQLIVGGDFTQVGALGPSPIPANNIAAWDGANWSPLGTGLTSTGFIKGVYALAVYNGELYAAGVFDNAGGVAVNNIAKWNGTSWSDVGGGLTDDGTFFLAYAEALEVYQNKLYVGGLFALAGGASANHIAAWDGTSLTAVGGGVTGSPFTFFATGVYDLAVFDGRLVATGEFSAAGSSTASGIAAWNGTAWSAGEFAAGLGGSSLSGGYALASDGATLYVGGDFETTDGLATPLLGVFNAPSCIGDFNTSGSVTVQDIFDFLAAYFGNDPRADVNGSGGISVQDIFDFLAAYFAGC